MTVAALRWLERAHRLAPSDPLIRLTLGTACLHTNPTRAIALFSALTTSFEIREAWVGLAAARLQLADHTGAATALAHALRHHSLGLGIEHVADAIVRGRGAPGWCGLRGTGEIVVRPATGVRATLHLDDQPISDTQLPRHWRTAQRLTVRAGDQHLLGSPIDIRALTRVIGCVTAQDGGIDGWAWHPGDPETDPTVIIRGRTGRPLHVTATEDAGTAVQTGPLSRPRRLRVPADQLAGLDGPFRVLGEDGGDLWGSPLPLHGFPPPVRMADTPPTHGAEARRHRPRDVNVIIPVHGHTRTVQACLTSVLNTVPPRVRVIVVDDASPELELATFLDRLAKSGRIQLVRHARVRGFPASANAGIRASRGRDVVLLNSDTQVPPGWLERLHAAAYRAPDIATVTPFSNNATILTYPSPGEPTSALNLGTLRTIDRLAKRANPDAVIDIPVGVGFCLYIRRSCLEEVGPLRDDIFAQGYGEENDFCLRARQRGWRHVALPGLFVGHRGGASFGAEGQHLRARNEDLLHYLHPGYAELVQSFLRADPLAESRRRLDLARWQRHTRRHTGAVILITHADGGGVERRITAIAQAAQAAGQHAVILRPDVQADGRPAVVVGDGPDGGFPNLRYALPDESAALTMLLRRTRPSHVEVHHLLHHAAAMPDLIRTLGVPYDVHVHDYAWYCPRISLIDGLGRYCGEPDLHGCEACVVAHGRLIGAEVPLSEARHQSLNFLRQARAVIVPSADTARRLSRHFPALPTVIRPHEDDAMLPEPTPGGRRPGHGPWRVCIAGAIGRHKGFDVLLACARDAAERRLDLEFVVVGDTIDDEALFATGRVFITGTYHPDEAVTLIRAQGADIGFLPSLWPETWSLTLTELWRADLRVAAFDLGAPADRIRATGRGLVLPLGLPAATINNVLLAAAGGAGHE